MSTFFALLFLAALVLLIASLIKPGKDKHGVPRKRKDLAIGFGVVAVVLLILVGVTAPHTKQPVQLGDASKNAPSQTDNSQSGQQTQSDTSSDNSQQPAPAPQPTTAQQVAAWSDKYKYIDQSLATDFNDLSTHANDGDIDGVKAACEQLLTDVKTAQGFPAIPDAQSASDFSSALTYFNEGAQDCIDGVANYDVDLISKGSNEISEGTDKITATSNDIAALTGSN